VVSLGLSLQFRPGCQPGDWPLTRPRLRRLVWASLPADCSQAQITIVVMGRAEAHRLNLEFRKKDYPTNILTFPYSPPPDLQADLVFCMPVIRAEAKSQGKPLDHHLAHLIVHGVLHAAGLDHDHESEAQAMEATETAILRRFRISDPYSENNHRI
jgi:probable rRNA maturation factor